MLVELRQILECSWKGEEEGDPPFPVLHEEDIEEDPMVLREHRQVGSVELPECGPKGHTAVPTW